MAKVVSGRCGLMVAVCGLALGTLGACASAQPERGGAAAPAVRAPLAPAPAARERAARGEQVAQTLGYYRMPAIRGEIIVFVSEGDLWRVDAKGGRATRLTSHAGPEELPAVSPDGTMLAFTATYEGPTEVYTMPLAGGLPVRRTWDGGSRINFVGWAGNDALLFSSGAGTTVPRSRMQIVEIGGANAGRRATLPLDQCDEAVVVEGDAREGATLVFTRLAMQGSHTDRYVGGTAQKLWRWTLTGRSGDARGSFLRGSEATPLTTDYAGTSRRPMVWNGRVYFVTDRDGHMNIWSMTPEGKDLQQHTRHADKDVGSASLDAGRIVYQLGADLWMLDIASGADAKLEVMLESDLDQTREQWVDKPVSFMTSARISPDGDRVVVTARGRVFVFPAKVGRTVEVDQREGVRYRDARFMPDGKTLVALSDESGEVEVATLPANGVGSAAQLTSGSETLRWFTRPSPDGLRVAHTDKLNRLWVLDVATKQSTLVEENAIDAIGEGGLAWSPDSRWLAYVAAAGNMYQQIKLWDSTTGQVTIATSDRYDSFAPAWSSDGKWLYFLSDRTFNSVVPSPWGQRAPEPFLDRATRIYALALKAGERWPFLLEDEVFKAQQEAKKEEEKREQESREKQKKEEASVGGDAGAATNADGNAKDTKSAKSDEKKGVKVEVDVDGLAQRIELVPVERGNYANLQAGDGVLFFESFAAAEPAKRDVRSVKISSKKEDQEPKTVAPGVKSFELSLDRKKILIHRDDSLFVIDAEHGEAKLDKAGVDLSGWSLAITPREEWRQMLIDSWRLLRDYFYDRSMHGVDWKAKLDQYLPLVDRVRDRRELSDLLAQMTGELSALHHFVSGGDMRTGEDNVLPGALGADLAIDSAGGGWRVLRVWEADSDEPQLRAPLAEPSVGVKAGDVIEAINGVSLTNNPDGPAHPAALLRNQAGRQVLLRVKPAPAGDGTQPPSRDVIVRPLTQGQESDLRYRVWQVERRRIVEAQGKGDIGYVHLRAMGTDNFSEFARDFYPVFNRKGLIIDVRDNRGGNIDSWLLSRLRRTAWMFWNQHAGRAPSWNMQQAFRGHMVVLMNERTASDGEAFSEGFRRLGLGKLIGVRTWGGMIWLTSSNLLVDNGLASAGEFGVFGPEGQWLIEGHGVDPDIELDNLPHATFFGEDAQLAKAIEHLQQRIREQPIEVPAVPAGPDKRGFGNHGDGGGSGGGSGGGAGK